MDLTDVLIRCDGLVLLCLIESNATYPENIYLFHISSSCPFGKLFLIFWSSCLVDKAAEQAIRSLVSKKATKLMRERDQIDFFRICQIQCWIGYLSETWVSCFVRASLSFEFKFIWINLALLNYDSLKSLRFKTLQVSTFIMRFLSSCLPLALTWLDQNILCGLRKTYFKEKNCMKRRKVMSTVNFPQVSPIQLMVMVTSTHYLKNSVENPQ